MLSPKTAAYPLDIHNDIHSLGVCRIGGQSCALHRFRPGRFPGERRHLAPAAQPSLGAIARCSIRSCDSARRRFGRGSGRMLRRPGSGRRPACAQSARPPPPGPGDRLGKLPPSTPSRSPVSTCTAASAAAMSRMTSRARSARSRPPSSACRRCGGPARAGPGAADQADPVADAAAKLNTVAHHAHMCERPGVASLGVRFVFRPWRARDRATHDAARHGLQRDRARLRTRRQCPARRASRRCPAAWRPRTADHQHASDPRTDQSAAVAKTSRRDEEAVRRRTRSRPSSPAT